jgi:choline kinase
MRVIILAAGRGSRMKNLTEEVPKCLVKLKNKTLLDWQLLALREANLNKIAIVTGYKRESLIDRGLKEFHNPRWAETNMVTSLTYASEWLEREPCIVSYSDIFYDASAVSALSYCEADLAVTYDANWQELWERRFGDPLIDAETFRFKPDGTIAEIGQKPKTLDQIEGQYMGLLRITPNSWSEILRIRSEFTTSECDKMHMTGTLQKVIEAGRIAVHALPYTGVWGEVDSEDDLAAYK